MNQPRYQIIGTAGHVDHGKTCLIRALTGIDTDRLAEEKKRGITIELGFASLELPDGGRAGIIDVPGHERFIRNMLAGAGGIDLAMLIVAADESVMPQTAEHLDILTLLNIRRGLVVITKADLADPDWMELVKSDISALVKGSFLEGAPVLTVSAHTGQGIGELREALFALLEQTPDGVAAGKAPRLPVDRVFTMEGFGTVVTGTLIEGDICVKQELMLYPSRRLVRVRSLQVHSASVERAFSGQRVAVNLQGLKKNEVARGDTLATPDSMPLTSMADVRLDLLKNTSRRLLSNNRLHFYHGSRETMCRIILMDAKELSKGQSGYARLCFEEEIALCPGDRFVVRFYSPMETVGGGEILDACPIRQKPFDEKALRSFQKKESGTPVEKVEALLRERSRQFYPLSRIPMHVTVTAAEVAKAAETLIAKGKAVSVTPDIAVHREYADQLLEKLEFLLAAFHRDNPLKSGMKREDIPARLLTQNYASYAGPLLDDFVARGRLKEVDGTLALAEFSVKTDSELEQLFREMENAYRQGGFSPPATDELLGRFSKNRKAGQAFSALLDKGILVRLEPQICMHHQFVEQAWEIVRQIFAEEKGVVLGPFRDRLGTSRKFAVAILEYFDRQKRTRKTGDIRIIEKAFL